VTPKAICVAAAHAKSATMTPPHEPHFVRWLGGSPIIASDRDELLVAALLIRCEGRGPLLYSQIRRGRGTELFRIRKLRTMRVDAEAGTGPVWTHCNDPRITRVGRFLRKSRLDELPQLWNVFFGTMSLVGPRPERPELLNNLALAIPFFEERMRNIKPGLTGLAQISLGYTGRAPDGALIKPLEDALVNPFKVDEAGGAEADDMRMKLLYDMAYAAALERFGSFLRTELTVIFKTPLVMLRGVGR